MNMHLTQVACSVRVLMYFVLQFEQTKMTDLVIFGFQPLYEF